MAGQDFGQENGKRAPAAAALAARGAEHPLAPYGLTLGAIGIVAVEKTVPVQGLGTAAKRTKHSLEHKSFQTIPAANKTNLR